jgi:hypothetical protein
MKTVLKILLILFGVGVVLVGAISIGAYVWFQKNKDGLKDMGEKTLAEGKAFGAGKASNACTDEAIRRLGAVDGMMQEVSNKLFLTACLGAANEPPGFCEAVPVKGEIMRTVAWAIEQCNFYQLPSDQRCSRLVQAIQDHCYDKKKPPAVQQP